MGRTLCLEAKKRKMGLLAMKSQTLRRWHDREDRGEYGKSWCKPIDTAEKEMGISAIKYAFRMGVDITLPPGNFKSFSFAVDNIEEISTHPVTGVETALLENEFAMVKDYPFF